jgi:DNA modification methylase
LPGRSPLIPDTFTIWHDALPNAFPGLRDKTLHAWQRGEGGARTFIEHLTDPGEVIVDPFSGTGTFAKLAHGIGRRVIACDLKPLGTMTTEAKFNLAAD